MTSIISLEHSRPEVSWDQTKTLVTNEADSQHCEFVSIRTSLFLYALAVLFLLASPCDKYSLYANISVLQLMQLLLKLVSSIKKKKSDLKKRENIATDYARNQNKNVVTGNVSMEIITLG